MFPANVPLPKPQTSAWIVGGTLHFIHFCVRVDQIRKIPDSDLGWEDMFHEGEGLSWFDWVRRALRNRRATEIERVLDNPADGNAICRFRP